MRLSEKQLRQIIRQSINESVFGITSHADNLTKAQRVWDQRSNKKWGVTGVSPTDRDPKLEAIRSAADEAFWDQSISIKKLIGFMRDLYTTLAAEHRIMN